MKNKYFAGVDVSKKTFDVSIYVPGTNLKVFPHKKFSNDRKGFRMMVSWLRKELGLRLKDVSFCMEYTGCYSDALRDFLASKHLKCHMVPPREMKARSGVVKDKNDILDSARIADYLARYNDVLKPTPVTPGPIKHLGSLNEMRRLLVRDRTGLKNRIQTLENDSEVLTCRKVIDYLTQTIEKAERDMLRIIEKDKDLHMNFLRLRTVPGIGMINAINIIVITKNFTSFENARQYASYVGVAPHAKTSGTSVNYGKKTSAYADMQAKADLSMAAEAAVRDNDEFKAFFERKTGNNPTPEKIRKAMNAVKFKLILRMFALVRKQEEYHAQQVTAPEVNYGSSVVEPERKVVKTSECGTVTSQSRNQDERSNTKKQQSQ